MPELIPVIDKDTIARCVANAAKQISADYQSTELLMVGVLKGAFIFMADLVRQLTLKTVAIDFVRLSSYGNGTSTSASMCLLMDTEADVTDKDVLIVEDILDTGNSLAFLSEHFKAKGARTIKICVLIDKRERRQMELKPDYVCHTVEQGFLVGYGLDCAEAYRNLPEIYKLNL